MQEGDKFEISYQVTPEIYHAYIDCFNDRNPLHTNETFAVDKGFSSVVMHGGILTGFLSNFIGEQLPIKNVIIQSYKIAFVKPVYLNANLVLKAEITGVYESVNCIVFKYAFQHEQKTICKGEISIGII
jgi:3-hydroxybutyryl-CoA dehydratase